MRLWIAALLVSATLAGCADGSTPDTEDDTFADFEGDLEATEDTGIIRGIVIASDITPISGVDITIEDPAKATVTDAEGRFGFAGLPPGFYHLTVSKLGFVTTTVQTNVEAGVANPPLVQVKLEAEPSTLPTTESVYMQGHIGCSVTSPSVSVAVCDLDDTIKELTDNEFILYHTFDRDADWVQSEMTWKSSQTLGDSMSLSWTDPTSGAQVHINSTAGPSPQMISFDRQTFEEMNLTGKELWLRVFSTAREGTDVIPEEAAQDAWAASVYGAYNGTGQKPAVDDALGHELPFGLGRSQSPLQEDCVEYPVLFDACLRAGGVGVTLQQDYEVFTTMFYNFRPAADWMFIVDGDHPLPENA